MNNLQSQPAPLESIDVSALPAVTGGGLFGSAWKLAKTAYHVAKPIAQDVSPFAYVAYKAHSLWHKLTEH